MQLVIEISDGLYNNINEIKNGSIASKIILNCVRKGQVLPKGHGDLKDMEDIYEALEGWEDDTGWIVDVIDSETPTIIEADEFEFHGKHCPVQPTIPPMPNRG